MHKDMRFRLWVFLVVLLFLILFLSRPGLPIKMPPPGTCEWVHPLMAEWAWQRAAYRTCLAQFAKAAATMSR